MSSLTVQAVELSSLRTAWREGGGGNGCKEEVSCRRVWWSHGFWQCGLRCARVELCQVDRIQSVVDASGTQILSDGVVAAKIEKVLCRLRKT